MPKVCLKSLKCACDAILSFFVDLLGLCGDVEENPGPDITVPTEVQPDGAVSVADLSDRDLILTVLSRQQEMLKCMNDFGAAQKNITDTLSEFKTRLDSLESSFERLNTSHDKVCAIEDQMNAIEKGMASLADKVDDLENRSRRNNIIVHGFDEPSDETLITLSESISENFFKSKLGLSVTGIERCHRLGSKRPNKIRPVIIKLIDFQEKLRILKNCTKLKGSTLYVTEDYSLKVRQTRKKLWDSTASHREQNESVKLVFDKVLVGKKLYAWNDQTNDRVLVPKHAQT